MTTISTTIAERELGSYIATLASETPTPGGGSAAGVAASLAAALTEMVCNITLAREVPPDIDLTLRAIRDTVSELRSRFLTLAQQDEEAYQNYSNATAMPRQTAEEKAARQQALQSTLRGAADIPMRLAVDCLALLDALEPVITHGKKAVLSDAVIAVRLLDAAIAAAVLNVNANTRYLKNSTVADQLETQITAIESIARQKIAALLDQTGESRRIE